MVGGKSGRLSFGIRQLILDGIGGVLVGDPFLPEGTSQEDIDFYLNEVEEGDCPECGEGILHVDLANLFKGAICSKCGYIFELESFKETDS